MGDQFPWVTRFLVNSAKSRYSTIMMLYYVIHEASGPQGLSHGKQKAVTKPRGFNNIFLELNLG